MAKFLLFAVVVVIIWFIVRAPRRKERPPVAGAPEVMVSCARCGLNFPAAESFRLEGRDFCSEDHRRLGAGS